MNNDPIAPVPSHAPQTRFAVQDNCLMLGGVALTRLAQRAGRTPFYAYDRQLLTGTVLALKAMLPAGLALNYSVKANPMPALVAQMVTLVDGFDVASAGELHVALNAGMRPEHIIFSGPGKTDAELLQALAAGVTINVESSGELIRLANMAKLWQFDPHLMLRINPDFTLRSSGVAMGGGAKPFGIDAEQIPALLEQCQRLGLRRIGFHIYAGSQNLNASAITQAQTRSCDLVLRIMQDSALELSRLNLGGGFGIPYFPGDRPLDMPAVAAHLHEVVRRTRQIWPAVRVEIESGRYLVGEAGIYVTRVIDRKTSRGRCFLVTDGGMNHHLAVTGNFGQTLRKNYPVAVGNKMASPCGELATVVGPLCTPLDMLADQMPLAHAEVGDLIVVFQSGAYGCSASPVGFLSHAAALEMLV